MKHFFTAKNLKTAWLLSIVVLYFAGIICMFFAVDIGLVLWFVATLFGIVAYFQKVKNDRILKKLEMEAKDQNGKE